MNKKPYRPGPKRPSNASRPRGRNRQMGGKNDKDTNLINEDYQKFKFQQRKHAKEQKAKSTKLVVKEIRFGPQTDEHDYNFKLKHAIGFLKEGAKVKSYVFFKGRSILFKEQGEVLLLRFANDLEEYGKLDQMPVLEGKRMTIMISPKKPGSKKKEEAKGAPEADTAAQQDNTPDEE